MAGYRAGAGRGWTHGGRRAGGWSRGRRIAWQGIAGSGRGEKRGEAADREMHLVENLHKHIPFVLANVEVLVRLVHWAAGVLLRPTRERAHNLHHQELEPRPLSRLMPSRDHRIVVERLTGHPLVHAAIDEGGDAEDATAPRVQRTRLSVDASCDHCVRVASARAREKKGVSAHAPQVAGTGTSSIQRRARRQTNVCTRVAARGVPTYRTLPTSGGCGEGCEGDGA